VAELAHPGEPARIEPVPELAREVV